MDVSTHRLSAAAIGTVLSLAAGHGLAEVKDAAADGFFLEVSREVSASPAATYEQFIRVGEWWNSEHTWFGDAANLSIDPQAGGCFCERDGKRSALHMLVSYVAPGEAMHMTGGLGPLQGLGLYGAMQWQFEPLENGGTRILHRYRVTGYYPGGLQQLAPVVDQVQTDQVTRLQARLNGPVAAAR